MAHVYNTAPFATTGLNYISGHGFSEDGLHWSEASEPSAALSSLLDLAHELSLSDVNVSIQSEPFAALSSYE